MYYLSTKGIWPFSKTKLVVNLPGRKEEVVKEGKVTLNGVTLAPEKGVITLKNSKGKTLLTDILSFDLQSGCITFRTPDGCGFVAENGSLLLPDQEGCKIKEVVVSGGVAVALEQYNKSRNSTYRVYSSKNASSLSHEGYVGYTFGSKELGIRSNVLFLVQSNAKNTVMTTSGHLLARDCSKYDKVGETLLLLSPATADDKFGAKTYLEGYDMRSFRDDSPTLTFMERNVTDFSAELYELITYSANGSVVYAGDGRMPKKVVFTSKGKVTNISPTFYSHNIYSEELNGELNLLDSRGQASNNPDLKGLKGVSYGDDLSLITTIETDNGDRQGLIRNTDFATILQPSFDKVRVYGEQKCVASVDHTFAIYGLDEVLPGVYSRNPRTLLPMNQYFNAQLTDKKDTLLAEDSYGAPCVLQTKDSVVVSPEYEYVSSKTTPTTTTESTLTK